MRIAFVLSFVVCLSNTPLNAQEYPPEIESMLKLGQSYYNQKKYLQTSVLFRKIVDSLEFMQPLTCVRMCKDIGAFYHVKRNHYEALNYFFRGINLITKRAKKKDKNVFYIKLLDQSHQEGRGFKTKVERDKGLALYTQLYSRLGGVYFNQSDFVKAKDYWTKSLNIAILNTYKKGMSSAFNNLAELKRIEKQLEEALVLYQKATPILKDLKDEFTLAINYSNIAVTYIELNQPDSARYYLGLSKTLANKQDDPLLQMSSFFNLGEYFYYCQRYTKAILCYAKALNYALALQDKNFLNDSYQRLATVYQKESKPDSALFFLYKWVALNEEIKAKEIKKMALETAAKFAVEEQKRALSFLKEKSKIEQEKAQLNERIFYGFIAGLLFVLGLVLFALHLNNQHNHKLSEHLQQIKQKTKEKDLLLKEIHHRVKNNLQIITSLLGLQSSNLDDIETKKIFSQSQSRIKSMALIHEMLYQAARVSEIEYKDYLDQLLQHIIDSNKREQQAIEYSIEAPRFYLNIDTAIPLGLLINEIVTNSIKYAFEGRQKGSLLIQITKTDLGRFFMVIEDDGIGYDHQKIKASTVKSLGLKLIYSLIKQLNGRVDKVESPVGVRYKIEFDMINDNRRGFDSTD